MRFKSDGKICQFVQKVKTKWQERQVFRKRDDQQLAKEPIGEQLKTQIRPVTKEELAGMMIDTFAEKMRGLKEFDPDKQVLATILLDEFRGIHADMSDKDYGYVRKQFLKAVGYLDHEKN